jgi:hypothetical protein
MPFKSKAQRRKFAELLVTGKITPEAYERWNKETGGAELPERVRPKDKKKTQKKATRKAAPSRRKKTTQPRAKRKAQAKRRG